MRRHSARSRRRAALPEDCRAPGRDVLCRRTRRQKTKARGCRGVDWGRVESGTVTGVGLRPSIELGARLVWCSPVFRGLRVVGTRLGPPWGAFPTAAAQDCNQQQSEHREPTAYRHALKSEGESSRRQVSSAGQFAGRARLAPMLGLGGTRASSGRPRRTKFDKAPPFTRSRCAMASWEDRSHQVGFSSGRRSVVGEGGPSHNRPADAAVGDGRQLRQAGGCR